MSMAAFPLSNFDRRAYLKHEAHEELMSYFCSLKPQFVLFHTTIVESFRACGNPLSLGGSCFAVIGERSPRWGDELAGD
jgi:hypothetical protein